MFETEDGGGAGGRSMFTRRAAVVGVLCGRLYQLQVLGRRQYGELADANRTTRQVLAPLQGRIFGRDGNVLADTEEFYQAVLTPSLANDVKSVLEILQEIKPSSPAEQAQIAQALGKVSPNTPIVVASGLSWKELSAINFNAPALPGVHTQIVGRRRYLHGDTMGRIIGYVGSVERFALDDDPVMRLPDTRIGKLGIERGLNDRLRGQGGYVVREVDARGRIIRNMQQTDPKRGQDIAVTVDVHLQGRMLKLLSQHRRAAGVVMDIATGDVVEMGASPMFDVSRLTNPITEKEWQKVRKAQNNPLIDRSIQGVYPPGSTFKMVTASAALEAGVIGRHDQVNCGGVYSIGNASFRCWNRSGHGLCNLHRAIRESCDVYCYNVARRLGITKIAAMARRLGLGQSYEMGIDPVHAGLVPDPAWKRGRFGKGWFDGETVLAGIGQGYILTTPLQLAVMTARIASGQAIVPTVVRPTEAGVEKAKPLGITQEYLDAVRRGMWAVVNEAGGTGKRARLNDEQLQIFGKSGTSQVARISSRVSQGNLRWNLRDHALFVGYIADPAPRYAIAAIVVHGGSGGKVAAPLLRVIAEETIAADPAARSVFDVRRGGITRKAG